jgi:hypothetical protein
MTYNFQEPLKESSLQASDKGLGKLLKCTPSQHPSNSKNRFFSRIPILFRLPTLPCQLDSLILCTI